MSNRRKESGPKLTTQPRSPAEALEPARGPSRPKSARIRRERPRVSAVVRIFSGFLTLALTLLAAGGVISVMHLAQIERPGPLEATKTVVIPRGEGRLEIAERLEREGIIDNRWSFVVSHLMQNRFGARKGGAA